MEKLSFSQAAMKFFGKKEGQSLGDFMKECKALTDKDRNELAPLLSAALNADVTP